MLICLHPILVLCSPYLSMLVCMGNLQDGQYLRPSDPAYEQVLDSLAMVARHTPVPLLEALLRWRERFVVLVSPLLFLISAILYFITS